MSRLSEEIASTPKGYVWISSHLVVPQHLFDIAWYHQTRLRGNRTQTLEYRQYMGHVWSVAEFGCFLSGHLPPNHETNRHQCCIVNAMMQLQGFKEPPFSQYRMKDTGSHETRPDLYCYHESFRSSCDYCRDRPFEIEPSGYEVGQRVELLDHPDKKYVGLIGVVVRTFGKFDVFVDLDDQRIWPHPMRCHTSELKLEEKA
jgi:hypothetical protein